MECTEDGKVITYLKWHLYPNGLGELGQVADDDHIMVATAGAVTAHCVESSIAKNSTDTANATLTIKKKEQGNQHTSRLCIPSQYQAEQIAH